ncbi:MAG: hypothetical protein KGQ42_04900 [Alphaproteobacteria bacterium]|nr:hypothetical protein [Alphaproteobacteria bacterium]MDE2042745.1 hypothetical protein [Alphaproteobacteria bacterium]
MTAAINQMLLAAVAHGISDTANSAIGDQAPYTANLPAPQAPPQTPTAHPDDPPLSEQLVNNLNHVTRLFQKLVKDQPREWFENWYHTATRLDRRVFEELDTALRNRQLESVKNLKAIDDRLTAIYQLVRPRAVPYYRDPKALAAFAGGAVVALIFAVLVRW